jgi:hypothetical protein
MPDHGHDLASSSRGKPAGQRPASNHKLTDYERARQSNLRGLFVFFAALVRIDIAVGSDRSIEQQTTHGSSQMHETSITTNVEAMLDSRSPYVNTLCYGKSIITIGIVKIVEFGR